MKQKWFSFCVFRMNLQVMLLADLKINDFQLNDRYNATVMANSSVFSYKTKKKIKNESNVSHKNESFSFHFYFNLHLVCVT